MPPSSGSGLGEHPRATGLAEPRFGPQAVLVPVKAFQQAKIRLTPALGQHQRAALARAMGERVLAAAAPLPVAVVCDDPGVATWAASLGALVIWEPGQGLNRAVGAGVDHLARMGVRRVTVAHADLPLANDLPGVASHLVQGGEAQVVIVPDRRRDGTNVISVPTSVGFRFSYGPRSFERHLITSLRLGLAVEVLNHPVLAWDVDGPEDLAGVEEMASRDGAGVPQGAPTNLAAMSAAGLLGAPPGP
jgi:2-phospho-L-lactate guanylyltransferase